MKRKVVKLLGVGLVSVLLTTTNVLASSPQFYFNLRNTGQNFQIDWDSANNKVYAGQDWTFKPLHLNTGSSPYGMLFAPYGNGTVYTSAQIWRKTGQYDKKYVPFSNGKKGTHYLSSRIDDDYSGPFATDGWWNADRASS